MASSYPVSVVHVTSNGNTATYRISLTDYHSPPKDSFTDVVITFTSNPAHQECSITVSYNAGTQEPPTMVCPEPDHPRNTDEVVPSPSVIPPGIPSTTNETLGFLQIDESITYFFVIVITLLAVCIGTLVICMAIKQSSSKSGGGFAAHLPQSPQQAFSPVGTPGNMSGFQTPRYQHTTPPIPGQSGGQSAFRTTGFSSSPQHGLFSQ